jgi:hypothetical protein
MATGDAVMDSWIRQMADIETAIRNLNSKLKELRSKKKSFEKKIYDRMQKRGMSKYGNITLKKVTPKAKSQRKKASEKKKDALQVLSEIGVSNPDDLYQRIMATQKLVQSLN